MTVSTFLQSNYNTQSGTAYPLAIDGDLAVLAQVAAQFAPHAAATPAMTVVVDAGTVFDGTDLIAIGAQASATIVAPGSGLVRIDRVVLDQGTGAASVLTGAAVSADPTPPPIPSGKLPCAQIALDSTVTAITDALIVDERNFAALGLGSAARYAIGTAGTAVPLLSGANTWSGNQTFAVSPVAPTPADGDASTAVATTAFVAAAIPAAVPAGTVAYFVGSTPPDGWLVRNGGLINRTVYAALFAVIGTTYGFGDGVTNFNVPDDRGWFLRGLDAGAGVDPGRTLGSQQGDAIRNITGSVGSYFRNALDAGTGALYDTILSGNTAQVGGGTAGNADIHFDASRIVPTAAENRPKNRAYLPIIKY